MKANDESGDTPRTKGSPTWSKIGERGSTFWIRFILSGIRVLGSAPIRYLVPAIALYYCLFDKVARRSSRDYLKRVSLISGTGSPKFWDIYRHVRTFAELLFDRFALWSGAGERFEVVVHERQQMRKLVDQQKSAMLVGAHLGSFDMLRIVAREANIPVNVIMYVGNSQLINEAFEILDPDSMVRVINLDPNSAQTAFELRRCVERGEFIAVLADRVAPISRRRVTRAKFMGEDALFPEGPFLLPLLLEIPTILAVSLKTGPRKYEVFMEGLSDGSPVRPVDRKTEISKQIQHFASRLEHYCLREPNQWFNFFDFWPDRDHAER